MTRCALALLGLLALPAVAHAQDRPLLANEPPPERLPHSRFAITPVLGARIPYTTGNYVVFGESGNTIAVREERGGGPLVGLNAEARLTGPLSFVGGVAYSGRRQDIIQYQGTDDTGILSIETDGPAMWFAKAGVAFRLADPEPDNRRFHPSAFITVAPAMVWMDWEDLEGAPEAVTGTTSHLALNLGADATARIGRSNWAFQLGLEDFITFWDTDELRTRDEVLSSLRFTESSVVVDYDYDVSNIFVVRVGASYRFGGN